jgi:hypothetical protein
MQTHQFANLKQRAEREPAAVDQPPVSAAADSCNTD